MIDVRAYGAKGDGQSSFLVLSIAAGTTTLTVNTAVFAQDDVGKVILVPHAGVSGAALVTTISVVADSRHISLAANANVSVLNLTATLTWGTDDTAAINSALSAVKTTSMAGDSAGNLGAVVFPRGTYLTMGSINLTEVMRIGVSIIGLGARIHSAAAGQVAVDALGSRFLRWTGSLDIYGDQYAPPKIGLQIGRTGSTARNSADNHVFSQINISGYFTLSALLDENAETTLFDKAHFLNSQPAAYAAIFDGINHWNATSTFVTNTQQADVGQSFNENSCVNCIFAAYGAEGTPVWIAGSGRLRMISSYIASFGTNAIQLYFAQNTGMQQLDLDVHTETGSVTDTFLLSGTQASVVLEGFKWRDNAPFASSSFFRIDPASSIAHVTFPNAEIDVATLPASSAAVALFANPEKWTISGRLTLPLSAYNAQSLSGVLCSSADASCTTYETLPSPLNVPSIVATGSVSSITAWNNEEVAASRSGAFYGTDGGIDYNPTLTLSPPTRGGTQATGHLTAMVVHGYPDRIVTGGNGYINGDLCTVTSAVGTSIGMTMQITAQAGELTAVHGRTALPLPAGAVVPHAPYSLSCPSGGSGAMLHGANWIPSAFAIDNPGSGYVVSPTAAVTCPSGVACPSGFGATLSVTNAFSGASGTGQLLLDGSGTTLGLPGPAGGPVRLAGALIDATAIRHELIGATYFVPANVGTVRFTQTTVVAAQTIVLPIPLADGQAIQFVNYSSPVTALTFRPPVHGWSDGAMLPANTGLRIRWDSMAEWWQREQ